MMEESSNDKKRKKKERPLPLPLLNHVVLRTIAKYIRPKDRVAARSVCRFWHEEFTKKIILRFRIEQEIVNFHKYNNENLKDDNRNLGNYFTKFSLEKMPLKNVSSLDLNSMINQLTEVANVKELYLPLLGTKSYTKTLLELISPTIELLSVELPFFHEKYEGIYIQDDEEPVIFENIKTLVIKAHTEVLLDIKIFRDILLSCNKVKIIHISANIMIPSTLLNWICENKPKLELITFYTSVLSTFESNCIKLIQVMTEGYVKEIKMGQYIFTKENISDYFHILAVYDDNKFVELSKKSKLYAGKQINNFNFISNQDFRYGISIKDLFYHFPNLRNLYYREAAKFSFVTEMGIDKVYPAMDGFFLNAMTNLNLGQLTSKISEIFPNLTSLTLIVKIELDLEPIYEKLGKLKHFNLTCMKKNIIGDEDVIGIPKKFISIMSLFSTFDFETLNELKNGIDFTLKPSIGLLKELEELHLYNEYDAIDNPDSKKLTKLSFYFGFRLLPKLRELDLRFPSITEIPEGHWNLLENDFPKLEKLRLPYTLRKYDVFRRLRSSRPNLHLQLGAI